MNIAGSTTTPYDRAIDLCSSIDLGTETPRGGARTLHQVNRALLLPSSRIKSANFPKVGHGSLSARPRVLTTLAAWRDLFASKSNVPAMARLSIEPGGLTMRGNIRGSLITCGALAALALTI